MWPSGGGENVPGIPKACATRNFAYLARGPWTSLLSLVITPDNFMMIRWQEPCEKGVTDGRTEDGRTCLQFDKIILAFKVLYLVLFKRGALLDLKTSDFLWKGGVFFFCSESAKRMFFKLGYEHGYMCNYTRFGRKWWGRDKRRRRLPVGHVHSFLKSFSNADRRRTYNVDSLTQKNTQLKGGKWHILVYFPYAI